ncbi:MAG: copper chaperone PCu(A)C [Gammaproteobacteria bacterium]|nr:copper chaperone PCu(A)C [Gammaproteobacteria bacterium]
MRSSLSIFLLLVSLSALAKDILVIHDPVIPEAPPSVSVLGGFMVIDNPTDKDVQITAISSSVFSRVEIHKTVMQDNLAKMIRLDSLVIPAKGSVALQHGAYHLMLFNPKHRLKAGDNVTLKLKFQHGPSQKITLLVSPARLDDSHSHHHP